MESSGTSWRTTEPAPVVTPLRLRQGHEQVAGTDVHVRSDGGVVLVHAVIVGGDRATADVGVLAEFGVAT